jgi:hypothetical protein
MQLTHFEILDKTLFEKCFTEQVPSVLLACADCQQTLRLSAYPTGKNIEYDENTGQ